MRPNRIVLIAGFLALVAKLWIAATTIGTTDVYLFGVFGEVVGRDGLAGAYEKFAIFNHTPLVGEWVAWLVSSCGPKPENYALALRVPGIVADFLSVLVLLRLRQKTGRPPLWALVLFALSPVSLMVSGYHGNVDPVLALLLLVAAWMCVEKKPLLCGVALGLACQIKVVPLLVAPVFAAYWWQRKMFVRFALAACAVTLAGWAPALISAPQAFCRNVLGYAGYWGIWGWSYALRASGMEMFQKVGMIEMHAVQKIAMAASKYLVIGTTLWLAWRRRKEDIFCTLTAVWAVFFVCAVGVAPQYFVWLAPFVLMASARWFAALTGAGAIFLFAFYNTISGGLPWHRGISTNDHIAMWGPWSLVPWAVLIAFLIWLAPKMWKPVAIPALEIPRDDSDAEAPSPIAGGAGQGDCYAVPAPHSPTMNAPAQPGKEAPVLTARVFWILFAIIAIVGASIRIADSAAYRKTAFDEILYRRYVNLMDGGEQTVGVFQRDRSMQGYAMKLNGTGAATMPGVKFFLQTQRLEGTECELPPTRFLYIYTSWVWKCVQFGAQPPLRLKELQQPVVENDRSQDGSHRDPALASLYRVACLFSVLLMLAGGVFAKRMLGNAAGLGVLALMACDPLQLHLSQHAFIDGFFTFWAVMCVWTTWECLRNPRSIAWLAAHTACLALMVMTKENAFFVSCALAVVVLSNRWLKFGTATPRFLLLSIAGPLLGVAILVLLSGGIGPFIEVYQTLVAKAQNLEYAQLTGDGPWHRYLIDLLIVSPVVLCLALGALFAVAPRRKEIAFFAVFVAASYLVMCNVRYGMNLRYASVWELPLRAAAFSMIWQLCARLGRHQWLAATLAVAGLCAYEFRQYVILATNPAFPLYETLTSDMLKSQKILKPAP